MQNDQSRAITAVLISGVILFAWQFFFAPPTKKEVPVVKTVTTSEAPTSPVETNIQTASKVQVPAGKSITISRGDVSYTLNNLLAVTESTYTGASASKEIFETPQILKFTAMAGDKPLESGYTISKISEESFEATNKNIGLTILGNIKENGQLTLGATKSPSSIVTNLKLKFQSLPGTNDNYQTRSFVYAGNDLETISVGEEEKEAGTIRWIGMDYMYHVFAVSMKDKTAVNITTSTAENSLTTFLPFAEGQLDLNLIFIKKNYDNLMKIGDNLHLSVDFGFFSVLAIPILRGLQFFYDLVLNYGIAIILLTFIIRLLTFPLQYKSTKSMKKMQIIQPELKKIQEKFKENPQRLQKESMELFKKAGANPISGCFPLLLQMPIFFAFYKVLYNAVELVDAPFYFWIHDLSQKDPYYVLPVLMTGAMFLQQKLTPTATTDPAQKKVMMFMPIVFGFIMKDLPSGLNLYIFVSTLIAIVLQMAVLKRIKG